jgi:E3 ubiquitin-protein ligase RNF1/2
MQAQSTKRLADCVRYLSLLSESLFRRRGLKIDSDSDSECTIMASTDDDDNSSSSDVEEIASHDNNDQGDKPKKKKRKNYYLKRSGRFDDDGTLVPKNSPYQDPNGTFKRPRGRQPYAMDWDDIRGVWIPMPAGKDPEPALVAPAAKVYQSNKPRLLQDGSFNRPPGRQPVGMDWNEKRGIWTLADTNKNPSIIIPEKRPRRGIDGTFLQPIEKYQRGMNWDAVRGIWVVVRAAHTEKAEPTTHETTTAAAANLATTPPQVNGHRRESTPTARSRSNPPGVKRQKLDEDGFSANSKWQEFARESDELTMYEVHRKPRRVISGRIHRPVKTFSNLQCVICLGFINNARIVMECLHRFCEDCIEKSLRMGRNECPICRTFVPSRRSLRPDPNFDQLIRSILGDAIVEQETPEAEEDTPARSLQKAIFQKKKALTSGRNKKHGGDETSPETTRLATATMSTEISVIELMLKKHSHEKQAGKLELPFLRLQGNATIGTLKTFLCRKLDRPNWVFQIYTTLGAKESALNDWTTLEAAASEQLKHTPTEVYRDYPTFLYKIKKL